jgi:putative PEP-CTERM system histidine kinase
MSTMTILAYLSAALGGAIALGTAIKAGRFVARWSFVGGMAVLAAESVCHGLSAGEILPERSLELQLEKLAVISLLPGTWLLFSLTYARGNARVFLVRWSLPLIAAFLLPPLLAIGFRADLIGSLQPAGDEFQWMVHLGWSGIALHVLLLVGCILVIVNLERTFRAAAGTMRWRIKFMLLGVGVLLLVRLYTSSQALLFRGFDVSSDSASSGALLVASLLVLRSLFRAGHFEMDVYPSQSILQGSITIVLAGVYLLIVGAFAEVVTYLGGDTAFGLKAFGLLVSLVLLALLLQSDRLRLHLRRFVSRNFQRPLYDYRTVWRQFTEATTARVEQADLCRSLVNLTAEMFQALSVSLWLVDEKKETLTLAGSTSLTDATAGVLHPQGADAADVIRHVKHHPEPVDIEFIKENWASVLRRCQPDEFHKGGTRACVPIVGGGEVLALMTIGDRVGGAAFSLQDFDLLKCVGDQAAASLRNVQLSQRLLQAKEFEAFQTMAAFFVHDLKNAASTLNLMLQNLPVHFNDPACREDALRGISKTVAHINNLIGRLSALRHELKIQAVECDLSEVVAGVLDRLDTGVSAVIGRNLPPLPRLFLDREQVQKVVTNLVLNAIEAVSGSGSIQVTASQENGWAVLAVADTGCGMSPEFINQSLFRAFQSTKKNGLGIGMFQSKMIVEAHGGRITATSEPGKGTVFRVFLPVRTINQ